MSRDFLALIDRVRTPHVEAYARWLKEQVAANPLGAGEHLFEIQAETNFARKLCRVDFVLTSGDNAARKEFSTGKIVGFPPMEGEVDGVQVQLQPFRWDNVIVEIPDAIWDKDLTIAWFNKWFGFVNGSPVRSPKDKPGEHIHICAWVEPGQLRLDLGSAPSLALLELIKVGQQSGASTVVIRDVAYTPPPADTAALN
jgi:hypothetical protein